MPVLLALAPELLVIAIALFALLLYLGYLALKQLLTYAINNWGTIAKLVGGPIDSALDAGYNAVKGWLLSALHPVVGLFSHPSSAVDTHTKANVAAHVHHQQVNQWIAETYIPAVTTSVVNIAHAEVTALRSYLNDQVVPAVATSLHALQGELDQDAAALRSIEAQVANLSDTVFGGHLAAAVAGLQQVVGTVQSQLAQAYRDLAAQAGGIQSVAAEAAGAYGYTDTQVRRATEAVTDQAAAGDTAVRGDVLDGLRIGNPALPVDLTQALAITAAAAPAITTFLRDCGTPMCDWFNGPQSNLGSIFGTVELAAFMALLAAAISDPAGTSHAVSGVADQVTGFGRTVLSGFGIEVPG